MPYNGFNLAIVPAAAPPAWFRVPTNIIGHSCRWGSCRGGGEKERLVAPCVTEVAHVCLQPPSR